MEHYSFLRELADSWGLLAMFAAFLVAALWALRPGGSRVQEDIANIPFRHEDRPADEPAPALAESHAEKEVRT